MFVLATGTFTDPSKLGPYLDEEIAQIHANHDKGLIVSQYLRADGKGVFVVWNGAQPILIVFGVSQASSKRQVSKCQERFRTTVRTTRP